LSLRSSFETKIFSHPFHPPPHFPEPLGLRSEESTRGAGKHEAGTGYGPECLAQGRRDLFRMELTHKKCRRLQAGRLVRFQGFPAEPPVDTFPMPGLPLQV
jgi:hypothetical protein